MHYRSIQSRLTVQEEQAEDIIEKINDLFDSLVVSGIPVFESELTSSTVCDVEDAQAVMDEVILQKKRRRS